MKDADSKEELVLDDPAQIEVVSDLRAQQYLAPFLRGEHTLSSAAAAVGVSPSTMAYWLPRFCDLGLVEVVGIRQRAGMASKVYQATAGVFVVNAGRVDPSRLAALVHDADAQLREAVEAEMTRKNLWAAVRLEIRGHPSTDAGVTIRARPAELRDGVVCLFNESFAMSPKLARALRDELFEVIGRFKANAEPGRDYLIHLALAPIDVGQADR
jgi:hypothetical protein